MLSEEISLRRNNKNFHLEKKNTRRIYCDSAAVVLLYAKREVKYRANVARGKFRLLLVETSGSENECEFEVIKS
jgi:hypothetical protein